MDVRPWESRAVGKSHLPHRLHPLIQGSMIPSPRENPCCGGGGQVPPPQEAHWLRWFGAGVLETLPVTRQGRERSWWRPSSKPVSAFTGRVTLTLSPALLVPPIPHL